MFLIVRLSCAITGMKVCTYQALGNMGKTPYSTTPTLYCLFLLGVATRFVTI